MEAIHVLAEIQQQLTVQSTSQAQTVFVADESVR
jgi:hypothetical protein